MRRFAILSVALLLGACAANADLPKPPDRKYVIFFQPWSAAIDTPAENGITEAATWAKKNPQFDLLVTGFADPTGSKEANELLSRLRAQIVKDQLVADGVPADHVHRAGKGSVPYDISSLESRRVTIQAINHR